MLDEEEIREIDVAAVSENIKEQAKSNPDLAKTLEEGKDRELNEKDMENLVEALDKATGDLHKPKLSKEETSDCCSRCNAACCRAFAVEVPIRPLFGDSCEPDWDRLLEECEKWGADKAEVEFQRENWVPIKQPWGFGGRVVASLKCDGSAKAMIWFSCRQLVDGRCQAYEDRPGPCKKYLCDPVLDHGLPPVEASCQDLCPPYMPGLGPVELLPRGCLQPVFDKAEIDRMRQMESACTAGIRLGLAVGRGKACDTPVFGKPAEAVEGDDLPMEEG